jgi:hypothetical protein
MTALSETEEVYERVLPDFGLTRDELAQIPWTLVSLDTEEI